MSIYTQHITNVHDYNVAVTIKNVLGFDEKYVQFRWLKEYCEFLEKTGRGYAIEELRKRHPEEF